MTSSAAVNNAQQIRLSPGRSSPLFIGSLLLGASLLFFGKDDTDYDHAVGALAVAGTALMTKNTKAHCTAVVGGIVRACSSTRTGLLGLSLQVAALAYAVKEELSAAQILRERQLNHHA